MNGTIESAGDAPEPGTLAEGDRKQHERHGVADADAAADETAQVRRLLGDVETILGVEK